MPAARAASQDSTAASPLPAMVGRWPRRVSSARVNSALISLSSATRIDSALLARGGVFALLAAAASARRVLEGIVGGKARGERSRAHRLDQIAGEAGSLSAGSSWRSVGRDQHDAARDRELGEIGIARSWPAPAGNRPARASQAAPAAARRRSSRRCAAQVRAPQRPSRRASSEASIFRRRRRSCTDLPVRSGAANGARCSSSSAAGSGRRDGEGGADAGRAFERDTRRPCARRCAWRWRAPGRCRRTCAWRSRRPARNRGRCAPGLRALMPMPVSRTWKRTAPGSSPGSTITATPPVSVNLMALPARLSSTWRRRAASPTTIAGRRSSTKLAISMPLPCARGASSSTVFLDQRRQARRGGFSRSSLPASILEKSRISSISDSSVSPEVLARPWHRCAARA